MENIPPESVAVPASNMISHSTLHRRSRFSFLRTAEGFFLTLFVLTALADVLFWRHPFGWAVGLYFGLLLTVLTLRFAQFPRDRFGRVSASLAAALCVSFVVDPGIIAFLLLPLLLVALALHVRLGRAGGAPALVSRCLLFAMTAWVRPLRDLSFLNRRMRTHPCGRLPGAAQLAAWIVPIVFACCFVALFAQANPVIDLALQRLRDRLIDFGNWFSFSLDPPRVIFWAAVAFAIWTLLRGRIAHGAVVPFARYSALSAPDPEWTAPFAMRCLILFNGVFLVQSAMDAIYLTGALSLPDGMTYAQYAHRGAYPLIATALIAALFILATFRPGGLSESRPAARRLVFLWLAQNVFLVFTALWRLDLYVEAYTLTRLRIAAAIWMLLVAGGLAMIFARIAGRRTNLWLVNANALMLWWVLYACAFIPFDRAIAGYNVAHCREMGGDGPPLDMAYMQVLGDDAVRAIMDYVSSPAGSGSKAEGMDILRSADSRLLAQLSDWRGWTVRRDWDYAELRIWSGLIDGDDQSQFFFARPRRQ